MFCNCTSLKEINISNFSTKNTKNINYMFSRCKYLREIHTSNFFIGDVYDNTEVFYDCINRIELERKFKDGYSRWLKSK